MAPSRPSTASIRAVTVSGVWLGHDALMASAARACFAAGRKPHGVEPGLLLIAERIVELHQRRAHRAHGVEHRIEPLLGGVEPAERAGRRFARTRGLQLVGGSGGGVLERLEARALGRGRLHLLLDPVEREMHQARGFPAAQLCELVRALAARPDASRIVARDLVPAPVAVARAVAAVIAAVAAVAAVAAISVRPVDSAEQIVVAVGPERSVIVVAPVGII